MLAFYHGLRATEVCNVRMKDVDLKHGRIWIARLKGSLSTEQQLLSQELRAIKRYLKQRGDSQLPWLFLTERGDQLTRFACPLRNLQEIFKKSSSFPSPEPLNSPRGSCHGGC